MRRADLSGYEQTPASVLAKSVVPNIDASVSASCRYRSLLHY